jgi:hypothetical protein
LAVRLPDSFAESRMINLAHVAEQNMWSLSNAFTSTFKRLDPVPQFKATAKLGKFFSQLPA